MKRISSLLRVFRRSERLTFVAAAAVGVLALAGFFMIRMLSRTEVVPAPGGAWREGIVGQPTEIHPVIARTPADKALARLVFARLGDLADTIEAADGASRIRVHLKDGLVWSDGQPLTSDDVVFTIDRIVDPDSRSPLAPDWQGVTTERKSQLELILSLPSPHSGFAATAANLLVAPEHLLKDVPVSNWNLSEYMTLPVGSGPYILASRSIRRDGFISSVELRKNPHFALQSEKSPAPLLERITITFVPREEELVQLFNRGKIQGFASFTPELLKEIKRPHATVRFPSPTVYAIFWNQNANPVLARPEVREALDLATDREAVAREVLHDAGTAAWGPLPSHAVGKNAATSSLEAAKALLEEAGWKTDAAGVRVTRLRGKEAPLKFTVLVPDVPFLAATAEKLQAAWRELGAEMEIVKAPLEEMRSGALKNRSYEAVLFGNTLDASLDLYPFWHSSQKFHPGLNLSLYANKEVDKLLEAARAAAADDGRIEKQKAAHAAIAADHAALFLFSEDYLYIAANDLKGAGGMLIEDPADRFLAVSNWHIHTRRVEKK